VPNSCVPAEAGEAVLLTVPDVDGAVVHERKPLCALARPTVRVTRQAHLGDVAEKAAR
jgi:hypothetical protein